MQHSTEKAVLSEFMERLSVASSSMLLLDYDGTLAPFQTDRSLAYPYPRVVPLLKSILACRKSRVILITGRPIAEMGPLLSPLHNIEIWGSHGLEHLLADGTYHQIAIAPKIAALLSQAKLWLTAAGLTPRTEIKPGGIAVHWRGMPDAEAERIRTHAQKGLSVFSEQPELELLEFEAGLEVRVAHPNKGDAVTSILDRLDHEAQVAYLGDDQTDENAFRVLNPRGLSILVRPEYRKTNAQLWLRPPEEMISFLEQWLKSLSP
ncbi:MAG: trehalose-phosphatase [Silvibacterium sp.]